jgi:glycosyltransferase involved in cell wall biosynthesis
MEKKRISVIVPNYNHEKFLEKRLKSILNQTYEIDELIFLDDASTDNSVKLAKKILKDASFPVKFCVNKVNSGSTFKQWYKGICLSKCNYIWIAESDDYCENDFLENIIKPFDDKKVVLSYCQSAVVDEYNHIIHNDYLFYTNEIDQSWKHDFTIDGIDELFRSFFIKNIIPNVSAVLFRKNSLLQAFEKEKENIFKFKVAGDWYIYVYICLKGKLSFISKVLNYHRLHDNTNRNRFNYTYEIDYIRDKVIDIISKIIKSKNFKTKFNCHNLLSNMNFLIKALNKFNMALYKKLNIMEDTLANLKKIKNSNKIAIFGLGKSGKMTYKFIKDYYPGKIKYFIDDNVKGKYKGIPIVTTNEFLEKRQNEVDFVVFGKYQHLDPNLLPNLKINYLKMENIE